MEKAKRKHSPTIVQKRLTISLFIILGLSIFFYFFPVVLFHSSADFVQSYALVPLLAIPPLVIHALNFGFRRKFLLIIALALVLAYMLYNHLAPCDRFFNWPPAVPVIHLIKNTPLGIFRGCGIFLY